MRSRHHRMAAILSGEGGAAPVVPAWGPSDIEGLSLDLDPSTITGSDSDMVALLTSKEGNAREFSQADDAKKPLLRLGVNGVNLQPSLSFDGTNDLLTSTAFLTGTSGTVVMVYRLRYALSNGQFLFDLSDEASATGFLAFIANMGWGTVAPCLEQNNAGGDDEVDARGIANISEKVYITIWRSSGTAYTMRVNGAGQTLTVSQGLNTGDWFGDVTGADNTTLGGIKRSSEELFFKGDFARGLVYDSNLSDEDCALLETYLTDLYNDPYHPELARAVRNENPLTTPTYDTSGEVVHPSIYDAGLGETWNGYRYWMAMTPYPVGNSNYENPSILVSSDGDTWAVPDGLTNPIVAAPGGGAYNSDCNLLVRGATAYIYYRVTDTSTYDKIYVISSTDGVTWSAPALLFTTEATAALSPAVVFDGTTYHMWCIDATASPNLLTHRTCSTPNGTWSAAESCTTGLPGGTEAWHLEVVKTGGEYHAVYLTAGDSLLYFARSYDGITWTSTREYFMSPSGSTNWDGNSLYKPAIVKTATGYDIWYGGVSSTNHWRIGRTTISFD